MSRCATVYAARALGLCILIGVLLISPSNSSGNLGCRFSPVCSTREVCREDKLFGTCAHRSASVYAYDLDPTGYIQLKNAIEYLLSRGYGWHNPFAQHSLKVVLKPYRHELDLYSDKKPPLLPNDSDFSSAGMNIILNDLEMLETAEYENNLRDNRLDASYNKPRQQKPKKKPPHLHKSKTDVNKMSDALQEMYYEKYLEYLEKVALEEEIGNIYNEFSVNEKTEDQQWQMDGTEDQEAEADEAWMFEDITEDDQGNNWIKEDVEVKDEENVESVVFEENDKQDYDRESTNQNSINVQNLLNDLSLKDIQTLMKKLYESFADFDPTWWVQLTEDEKSLLLDQALLILLDTYPSLTPKPITDVEILEDSGTDGIADSIEFTENGMIVDDQQEELFEPQLEQQDAGEYVVPDKQSEPTVSIPRKIHPRPTESNSFEEVVKQDNEKPLEVNMEKKEHDLFNVHNNPDTETTIKVAVTSSRPAKKNERLKNRVFIITNESLAEHDGERVVEQLSNMLNLPEDAFTDIRVKNKKVTFTVNSKYNNSASDIASKAAQLGVELHKRLGPTIRMTGAGSGVSSEIHTPQVERSDNHNPTLIILTLILVGCVLGVLLAVIAIFCYRQKIKTRDKLKNVATGSVSEKEATVDYQDLCRQRMACKNAEKPEPLSRMSSVGHSDTAQPSPSRSSRSSTSSWSEEPVQTNMDISTGHLVLTYMEDHVRNKDRLTEEWNALSDYEAEPNFTNVGQLPENLSKNRFEDVLPYDHTRVILKESADPSHSDYVNASVITDSDPRAPAYICTQAPLPNTMSDFWEMIWEQGVVVIVNLTRPAENDIVQCEKYWPEEENKAYNNYEVHLVSEHVWCDDYLVRSFYLKNLLTNETRTVTQFHYLTWPDNGIPVSPRPLLEFRRKVNKSYRGRCCPIVVHCSDGIGRTGTYCLIDMTLTRMIKGAKEIDLAATLEHVRDQRPGMVRTKEQFEFVLTAVADEVNAILKAIPQ